MSVSCEASSKFHRTKLPKRAFRAKLQQFSQKKASKMIVSREASPNFTNRRFQNERFARGFLEISQNKLPKRAFRAMLPTISQKKLPKDRFVRVSSNKASKTSVVSRDARQFSQKKLPNDRFVRGLLVE